MTDETTNVAKIEYRDPDSKEWMVHNVTNSAVSVKHDCAQISMQADLVM